MRAQSEFDKKYYDRFYRNPNTRAADKSEAEKCADFVAAYLNHLEIPLKRIADVGCGLGHMLRRLKKKFPSATCDGFEYSEYLCETYGWTQASVLELTSDKPYDLVVCNDVVQYLDDRQAAEGLKNLAALTSCVMFFSALTREDWEDVADRKRTDDKVYMRSVDWYRRRLRRDFWILGGGLYLRKDAGYAMWHLDRY